MKAFSIKLQLSMIFVAMAFILLSAQLGLQLYVMHEDIVKRIEKQEFKKLTDLANDLDEKLQDSVNMLANVALNAPVTEKSSLATLENFLQREHALLSVYDDLYIFDTQGVLLVDWPIKPGRRTLNTSSRDYIKGVINTNQPVISKPILGKATKQPIVVVAAPILDKDKRLVGIMGGVINLYKSNFLGSIANRKNGDTGHYYLVSKDRLLITHPDPDLIFHQVPLNSGNLPFEAAMTGFEGTQEGYSEQGIKGLFTFKKLVTTDWIIASVVPSEEAFAPIENLFKNLIGASVLLMLFMTPLLWVFAGRLMRPLKLLATAMHQTANKMHDGQPTYPIAAVGGREIKTVVYAFNDFVEARKRAENDLSQARDAAQAANTSKSYFLANMSHEIRTPMNGILGMTELCLQTQLTTQQRSYLNMVASSANSLLAVVNDVLDFSKIESRQLILEPHPFSLHTLIRQVTLIMSLRAAEKELEFVCDVAHNVPDYIVGDPLRLQQVIINLLSNAIKFTAQGEIVFLIKHMTSPPTSRGVWLEFIIKDTGIGISPDKQAIIFDAFTQADSSTARRFGGSGLGLAISHHLVQMMGGDIRITSEIGYGSTFSFYINFQDGLNSISHQNELPSQLAEKTIIIVDDNTSSRKMLCQKLTFLNLNPIGADCAAQALHLPQLSLACWALIDINMPDIDGYALVRQLRHVRTAAEMPIIMMGALSEQISQEQLNLLDIQGFLVKPVDLHELVMMLSTLSCHITSVESISPTICDSNLIPVRNVLLVEDTPINQTLLTALLIRMGYAVTIANNGIEAVEAFSANTFDIILMDIQMPEMDGIEATKVIRSMEKSQAKIRTPIIAVTANALKGDRERYIASGMDGYVSKPVNSDSLRSEIKRCQDLNDCIVRII
jgi:signal transduction histidine kinase/CheY-like chemotaxis protein